MSNTVRFLNMFPDYAPPEQLAESFSQAAISAAEIDISNQHIFEDNIKRINDIQSRGNSAEIKYSTFCDGYDFYQSALILEIKGE